MLLAESNNAERAGPSHISTGIGCWGVYMFSGTNIPYTESVLTYATNLIPAKSILRRGRQAATKYNRPRNS